MTALVRYLTAFNQRPSTSSALAAIDRTTCNTHGSWWSHPAAAEAASSLSQIPWGQRAFLGRPQQLESSSGLLQLAKSAGHQSWAAACCICRAQCHDSTRVMETRQSFWMGQQATQIAAGLEYGQAGLMPVMLDPMMASYLPMWHAVQPPSAIAPSIRSDLQPLHHP